MPLFQNRTDFEYVERFRKLYKQRKKFGTVFLFVGIVLLVAAIWLGWIAINITQGLNNWSAVYYEIGVLNGFVLGISLSFIGYFFVEGFHLIYGSRKERILLESFNKSQRVEPTT